MDETVSVKSGFMPDTRAAHRCVRQGCFSDGVCAANANDTASHRQSYGSANVDASPNVRAAHTVVHPGSSADTPCDPNTYTDPIPHLGSRGERVARAAHLAGG